MTNTVELKPFSKRIKELIKIHGSTWIIIETREVQCFNSTGVSIRSIDGNHSRWVKPDQIIPIYSVCDIFANY